MSKFLKNLINKSTLQKSITSSSAYQDDDEINYATETEGSTEGSSVYGAFPVESSYSADYSCTETAKDIQLIFEGENKDTFVLVPGFLPYGTIKLPFCGGIIVADYWRDVKEQIDDPYITNPNSFSSLHDRAVELYYQIKGGQVDYGRAHSRRFCHKQLGQTYEGLVPDWSPENPIVLIGKGYGATTALHLQHLLSTNFFGQHTSGNMIKGVICWSAPHRGSTLPYYLGLEPGSKCIVNPISILQLLLSLIHLACYFSFLERFFNFHLNDQWYLASKSEGGEQSLCSALTARSRFTYFGDNFLVDWSVEGTRIRYSGDEKDKHILDPNCVYINYVSTCQTWKSKITGYHWPRLSWRNLPTIFISFILGRYKFSPDVEQKVLRTASSTFWSNDGSLSVYSQQPPPHQEVLMNIALDQRLYDPIEHEITPGVWYNVYVDDRTQTFLFDNEPILAILPLIENILKWSLIKKLNEFLMRYIDDFESFYVNLVEYCEFKLVSSGQLDDNVDTSSKSFNTTTISERVEKYSSDKAGLDWIHKIETIEILNSPSKMFYWVKKYQASLENGILPECGINDKISGNPFTATPFMQGPTFVKAKHKLTAEDYKASVI
ncbi:527_t:CDS:2 [Racocetra persica]|uniref:527_t:CDS:1 n=1 Tax=Racocetra persica TaxID=160502 RepID=A0ACA9L2S2_9GLOM|nr:527_t:CDS:2 [Racocetra persica]